MAVEVQSAISKENIKSLIDYFQIVDERSDVRPDVISKHPRWDIDAWPQQPVKELLDKVLDYDYEVDEVIFNESQISFRLHVDSGTSEEQRNGHAILIPLQIQGEAHTVFFDNYWYGNSTKFSKETIKPFSYNLKNKKGEWQMVDDVRILLMACENEPEAIDDFEIDEHFIKDLHTIIAARSNQHITKTDGRTYDYTDVVNYDQEHEFDNKIREKYISHLSQKTLNGLTIDKIAEWKIGDCIVFPRTQLHSASSSHDKKLGITIFTKHP